MFPYLIEAIVTEMKTGFWRPLWRAAWKAEIPNKQKAIFQK